MSQTAPRPFRLLMRLKNNRMVRERESLGMNVGQACRFDSDWLLFENLKQSPLRPLWESVRTCLVCTGAAVPMSAWCGTHTPSREERARVGDTLPQTWRAGALRIANKLGREPEYLWPEEARGVSKAVELEVSRDQAQSLAELGGDVNLAELSRALSGVLSSLTPREEQILRLHFGLEDEKAQTLDEIAGALDLSRERVRQIEARALRKLRHSTRAKSLKGYVL